MMWGLINIVLSRTASIKKNVTFQNIPSTIFYYYIDKIILEGERLQMKRLKRVKSFEKFVYIHTVKVKVQRHLMTTC